MTEEEIIRYLENVDKKHIETNKTIIAIEGLLDLYQKEKEKNKELTEMLEHKITYCNELEQDLFENSNNYVINKDKIRQKIEEIENIRNEETCELALHGFQREAKIEVLQELLEEE